MSLSLDGHYADFLRELVGVASKEILLRFGDSGVEVERKEDDSPVTIADREAEMKMRELINANFPEHGIIGEEWGEENTGASHVWMLDPIDGTVSFATGVPLFATLIALIRDGEPVLGAIAQPVLSQLCVGNGQETRLNGASVKMRKVNSLEEATLLSTCVKNVEIYQRLEPFMDLVGRVRVFRTWGDAYGYLLLATGWADIMVDPVMNPWDLAPLAPIIQGAGGTISSWSGGAISSASSTVAASPALHGQVIDLLNRTPSR